MGDEMLTPFCHAELMAQNRKTLCKVSTCREFVRSGPLTLRGDYYAVVGEPNGPREVVTTLVVSLRANMKRDD